jgi:hypothetical protein
MEDKAEKIDLSEIPAEERWIFENEEIYETVKLGVMQSKAGQVVDWDSFAQSLNGEISPELEMFVTVVSRSDKSILESFIEAEKEKFTEPQGILMRSDKLEALSKLGVFETYAENNTPQDFQILWQYVDVGGEKSLKIVDIVPHP